ncbi:MAG: peroxiredoxin [Candidatus Melainabacteria bacterium]|nr:peroxiredoxin [Candidatus Melainabacteria bacterium]
MATQTELTIGQNAPEFKLKAYPSGEYSLSQFKGKKNVILAFYPKDDTPGCTTENCAFRDDLSSFEAAHIQVFGISCDDVKSHEAFSKKFNFTHPLLSDVGGEVAKKYGTFQEQKGYASRKLFVIDKNGKIQKIVDGMPSNSELLEFVKGLK